MRAKIVNNDDLVDDDGISDVMEWVGTGTAVGRSAGGKVVVDSVISADADFRVSATVGLEDGTDKSVAFCSITWL